MNLISRAPHGARGLKPLGDCKYTSYEMSRPAWGAWIETSVLLIEIKTRRVAPRMGRVD